LPNSKQNDQLNHLNTTMMMFLQFTNKFGRIKSTSDLLKL